jgi:hypothetical protein
MKNLIYIFFVIFVSCINIRSQNSIGINDNNKYISTESEKKYSLIEGVDFVILPYEPSTDERISWSFKEGMPTELTTNDLEIINKILQDAVNKYNNGKKFSWENNIKLEEYKRQYIAIINNNGEKEVYVNCFRSKSIENGDYWKNEFIFVLDGGNNFFNVIINLTKMMYYDFMTNGYA